MSDPADDPPSAVERAESAIRPVLEGTLRDAVESDRTVADALAAWTPPYDPDGVRRAAARQASVLTNHARYRAAVGSEPPAGLRTTPVVPFRDLPTPPDVVSTLGDLEAALERSDLGDHLGARYADVLPESERRARGQFYTPVPVADLLTRWALDCAGGRPRVLDPAAGTGTFPVVAFDRLRECHPEASTDSLLSGLVAVDVDDVALHFAALRLSAGAGGHSAEAFDRRPRSFFDLDPGEDVAPVDAVVGNPPFVRAGDLEPDRSHYREHLRAYGPEDVAPDADGGAPYVDGDRALSRRSDASVYFLTHATRFLRPGGRLGVVLPAKWLESDYGVGFRRFLADQYRVRAVVGFGARAFDALVDTVLLLAERRERPGSAEAPGGADVRFLRLDGPVEATGSLDALLAETPDAGDPAGAPTGASPDHRRVVRRSQSTFATARQCSPYLRAPAALLDLLEGPDLVELGDLASVSRGVTTGANRFFLLDPADRERWGIDTRFLRPALRSIRGFDARTLDPDDSGQSILDVHGFLDARLDDADASGAGDPVDRAKRTLVEEGHGAVVEYVDHAEERGWHEGRTCQSRRVWFDLGPLPRPDAFVPKLLRERVFTVRNRAGAVPSNAIDCLSVREGVDAGVLLGVLDSSLCRALMEVWGRDEAGMLQLMTYETRTLPVPDVRTFSAGEASAIREAATALDADDRESDVGAQEALDAAVLDALDVDLGPRQARRLRDRLLRRRVDGGDRPGVPVS